MGDPGYPRRGVRQPERGVCQPIILAISSQKLHQIDKKNLTEKEVQMSSCR